MREPPHPGHRRHIVEHILEGPAAKAARHRRRRRWLRQAQRFLAIPVRVARQRGVAVDPAFLKGDPVRAHIAFFDDVDPHRARLGDADGGAMQRPAVAEQDEIADRLVDHQAIEKFRPFMLAAAKVDRAGPAPERPVAAVEIDPVHGVAARRERGTQIFEKSGRHPLQKEKGAIGGGHFYHGPPARLAITARPVSSRCNAIPRTQSRRAPGERRDNCHTRPDYCRSPRPPLSTTFCGSLDATN